MITLNRIDRIEALIQLVRDREDELQAQMTEARHRREELMQNRFKWEALLDELKKQEQENSTIDGLP